jgi:hypothetical protein
MEISGPAYLTLGYEIDNREFVVLFPTGATVQTGSRVYSVSAGSAFSGDKAAGM